MRRFIAISLMVLGSLLILSSPWLIFSFRPIHGWVFKEGWGYDLGTGECNWLSGPNQTAMIAWFLGFALFGVAVLFAGVRLFRSLRFRRTRF
jgi:hypothetical protein